MPSAQNTTQSPTDLHLKMINSPKEGTTVHELRRIRAGKLCPLVEERPDQAPGAQIWHDGEKLALAFSGKGARPRWFIRFHSTESMRAEMDLFFSNVASSLNQAADRKAEDLAKKVASGPLAPGTFLQGSWGWEQTQQEFYIVLEAKGSSAVIQRLAEVDVEQVSSMSGYVKPDMESRLGEPVKVRCVFAHGTWHIKDPRYGRSCTLTPSDPNSKYYVSSYA